MPCLVALVALFAPRLVIILLAIFSDWLSRAYDTMLWPVLGFFLMPYTTLAYALAWHMEPAGSVRGLGVVVIVVAVLIDLGALGGGASTSQVRTVRVRR